MFDFLHKSDLSDTHIQDEEPALARQLAQLLEQLTDQRGPKSQMLVRKTRQDQMCLGTLTAQQAERSV